MNNVLARMLQCHASTYQQAAARPLIVSTQLPEASIDSTQHPQTLNELLLLFSLRSALTCPIYESASHDGSSVPRPHGQLCTASLGVFRALIA